MGPAPPQGIRTRIVSYKDLAGGWRREFEGGQRQRGRRALGERSRGLRYYYMSAVIRLREVTTK
jgi:hypothetical protein